MVLIVQRLLSKQQRPRRFQHNWSTLEWSTRVTKVAMVKAAVITLLNLTACQTASTVKTIPTQTTGSETVSTTVITVIPPNQAIIINDSSGTTTAHTSRNDSSDIYVPNDDMYSYSHSNKTDENDAIESAIPAEDASVLFPPVEHPTHPLPPAPSRPQPIPQPSYNDLLTQARQNSQQSTPQNTSNESDLPAFRKLMDIGVNQLKAGQLTAAENSFTRAQRLAPKSSAVYFYLAQVALKKNQPHKAEAMARRGLIVSEDASRKQALWQLILQAGQLQNNQRVINEARQALR